MTDDLKKLAEAAADKMFFGPHKPECEIPADQTMTVRYGHALEVIQAAILNLMRERDEARERAERFEKLDREAATYVESVIAMRTDFTGEPPYVGWKGLGLALTEALDKRDAAEAALSAAREENLRLRAALATSKDPCVYCQLPAEDMARCRAGFPGCDRMDDITGCAEFGAMMENHYLREENEKVRAALADYRAALKNREHGGVAAGRFVDAVEATLTKEPTDG